LRFVIYLSITNKELFKKNISLSDTNRMLGTFGFPMH